MKRVILLIVLFAVLLSGCGLFDETFVVEDSYTLAPGKDSSTEDSISVTNRAELRDAIQRSVAAGEYNRIVIFDSRYSGNPSEDLAAACWQVRTEDALCAYCVENIAYEISQFISVREARITISYSTGALPVGEIITMPYVTGLNDIISEAIRSGCTRTAVLINRSTLTTEDMTARVADVYCQNPGLAPQEPVSNVSLFSGTGMQRLYEIALDFGMDSEEFMQKKEAMSQIVLPVSEDNSEVAKATCAANYLKGFCDPNGPKTIFDAIVQGKAGPEGISFGYVELCRRLGLECIRVYGQLNWKDYFWNIVRIDGNYYHVDLFRPEEVGWFKTDEEFWGKYRWNINDYPKCINAQGEYISEHEEADDLNPEPEAEENSLNPSGEDLAPMESRELPLEPNRSESLEISEDNQSPMEEIIQESSFSDDKE